jgi:hypothetical protein
MVACWIHRIMTARDPDWRSFPRAPMTAATANERRATEIYRREK